MEFSFSTVWCYVCVSTRSWQYITLACQISSLSQVWSVSHSLWKDCRNPGKGQHYFLSVLRASVWWQHAFAPPSNNPFPVPNCLSAWTNLPPCIMNRYVTDISMFISNSSRSPFTGKSREYHYYTLVGCTVLTTNLHTYLSNDLSLFMILQENNFS